MEWLPEGNALIVALIIVALVKMAKPDLGASLLVAAAVFAGLIGAVLEHLAAAGGFSGSEIAHLVIQAIIIASSSAGIDRTLINANNARDLARVKDAVVEG